MQARDPSSLASASASGDGRAAWPSGAALARIWIVWWLLCGALWMVLDDTTVLPELVDGAVAAAIGATGSTLALKRMPMRFVPRPGWARHWWRPWAQVITGLPVLIRVLARALAGGDREPGELRWVSFALESDPEIRDAQVALASFAGSVASNSVVVAVDESRESMLVHELEPRSGRGGPDPLGLGGGDA
jgi:hypothetical protein